MDVRRTEKTFLAIVTSRENTKGHEIGKVLESEKKWEGDRTLGTKHGEIEHDFFGKDFQNREEGKESRREWGGGKRGFLCKSTI